MRHRISGNTLNRKTSHRKATVRDIAKAVLINERITTTKVKAKEARKLVDQLITLGKKATLADKRRAFAVLCDHKLVSRLFEKIAPRFNKRAGGYTRLIPVGLRKGDNADLVFLELTEKEKIIISKQKSAKKGAKVTKGAKADASPETKKKTVPKKTKADKADVEGSSAKDKPAPKQDKSQDKKKNKFVGGLRKMFNRKSKDSE